MTQIVRLPLPVIVAAPDRAAPGRKADPHAPLRQFTRVSGALLVRHADRRLVFNHRTKRSARVNFPALHRQAEAPSARAGDAG